MRNVLLSLALVASLAVPAEAAIVYTKDGRTLSGAITVEETQLVVTPAEGEPETIPYSQVQGVSLDDEPLYPAPRPMSPEWGVWAGVATNVVAIATAVFVASWVLSAR